MKLDIRMPMGVMFVILGPILVCLRRDDRFRC